MKAPRYRALRIAIGTQETVAALLDVHVTTLSRRENGRVPITREEELAILALHYVHETLGVVASAAG